MTQPEQHTKKPLSETELEQAAGGRAVAPRAGDGPAMGDAVPIWIDADGIRHLGERSGTSSAPVTSDADGLRSAQV